MPRSMTGYGAAQATGARLACEIEIRAVNARSLKVSFRTPSFLTAREPDLEKLVRARLRRGTVTCYVRIQLLAAEDVIRVRPEVIEGLEVEAGQLNRTIHGPNFYREPADTIKAALARLEQVQTELEQSYVRWEELEARRGSFRG